MERRYPENVDLIKSLCRQLKTRYDEEIQAFRFAVGYIPGVVGEKRKAVEHCCEHIEINSH